MPGSVEVTFLGTSGSIPQKERYVSSILVKDWTGFSILLDAGEGAQLRMLDTGYSPMGLDTIMITHSHGDHINGVAGLLQSMAVQNRSKPLWIIGHKWVTGFIRGVLQAERRRLGYPIYYTVISDYSLYGATTAYSRGGDSLVVGWFKTCHTFDSYGFILEWRLRARIDKKKLTNLSNEEIKKVIGIINKLPPATRLRIVYTGDTAPCKTVTLAAMESDLLIHDASFDSSLSEEAHEKRHSTALDAATTAAVSHSRLLVLTHISSRYRGYEARLLLNEARKVHEAVLLGYDLMKLRLTPPILVVDPIQILDDLLRWEGQTSQLHV